MPPSLESSKLGDAGTTMFMGETGTRPVNRLILQSRVEFGLEDVGAIRLTASMSVVYVLTTLIPEDGGDDAIVEQIRKRAKTMDSLEAKYMAEDASSKKFLVSNFTNYIMTDSRPVLEQYNELLSILGRFTQHKMNMDEAIQVSCIIDKLLPSWKYFKHTLKHLKEELTHLKEELTLVELGSHLRIKESLRVQDSNKLKGNNVAGPLVVNMVEHNNSSRYNENKGKRKHHDNTRADPNKKAKPTCWKCGKIGHIKRDCKGVNVGNKANGSGTKGSVDGSSKSLKGKNMFNKSLQVYYVTYVCEAYFVQDDDVTWWVDSGATVHVCKDRCWFKTYESLNDGSILHMGNESTARLNIVNDNIALDFMSTSKLNDSILWHARLGHVHFKRMQDMSKDGLIPAFDMDTKNDLCDLHATPSLGNKKYSVPFIDDASRFCYVYLLHTKDEALDKFKVFKTEVELQQGSLIKRFRTDMGGEYMDTLYFQSVGIIHEMTPPYTPRQNGISKRKNRVLKEMVNFILSYSGLSQGDRGIECIFVRYVEHSKAFRFHVIEPNDSISINSIIESRDAISDENIFSSVPRLSLSIPYGIEDIGGSVVPEEVTEEVVQQPKHKLRKSKRNMTPKNFGLEFQLYLIEGTRDEVSNGHSNCFNVEDNPKTFDEAMKSQDVTFWKEAINDEMDSIMDNNIWVLVDLSPGCK
ncbi:zinc finger, CCHC-type containing protein, partial [Tanacetum coccineum]